MDFYIRIEDHLTILKFGLYPLETINTLRKTFDFENRIKYYTCHRITKEFSVFPLTPGYRLSRKDKK